MQKRKMVKCKNPSCNTMIRYDKRRPGFCIKHYDKTKRAKRIADYNRRYKTKVPGMLAKDLNIRTESIPHIITICDVCHTVYLATPGAISKGGANCCSSQCVGVNAARNTPNKDTSIELAIEGELKQRGVLYEKQVPLCGVTIADFFIPEFNIVIFCDGEYWHNLPDAKRRNKMQNKTLKKNGYLVFRFLEKDIIKSPSECIDKINLLPSAAHYQLRLPISE